MEWTDEQRAAFGRLWKEGRDRLGLTQAALAEQADVTQSVVSAMERGPYEGMRFLDIAKMAFTFGIPLAEVCSVLGMGRVVATQPRGIDVLAQSLTEDDREFLTEVVEVVVKGLRA